MSKAVKDTGAFRWDDRRPAGSTFGEEEESFGICGVCNGMYRQLTIGPVRGFGSHSTPFNPGAWSTRLKILEENRTRFENLAIRCKCDLIGDMLPAETYARVSLERKSKSATSHTTPRNAKNSTRRSRSSRGTTGDLAQLVDLFERGVLNQEQFEAAKNKLLGIEPATTPTYPAAWYQDPTRRYALRYWDGRAWTAHVAGAGGAGQTVDPHGAL